MTAPASADTTATSAHHSQSPLRGRRSPRLVAAGILLASLGGLGAGAAWSQTSDSRQVVVMVKDVARGELVEAGDLASTTIGAAPGVRSIPADQISGLVGKQALTDLPAGVLVSDTSVGIAAPEKGAVLGLRLTAGRIPQQPMPAGTRVMLVPIASTKPGAATAPTSAPIEAKVVSAPSALQDGTSWVVDIEVDEQHSATVAQLAATDQLVLVKKPRS